MNYVMITNDNIDKEHICCASSENKAHLKKEWLKQRFVDGLVYYRSEQRGECFIEYMPAEKAWIPLEADGYMYINCLWVAGPLKGKGYSNDLLNKCLDDAKKQNKKGICILSSEGRKQQFLSDPKYMAYKGFMVADSSDCGINLLYLPLKAGTSLPKFKECAKHPKVEEDGMVLYYSDQCPFAYYWANRIKEIAIENNVQLKIVHITNTEEAQNVPTPVTNYALFKDSKFLTHIMLSEKKFLSLSNTDFY
ncbi:MAG: YoaP domain-containing protein [Erysipelotrichia bacterium]|nr:YoaP domain-containing protein [Erysipelotrichia bacterium]